MGGGSDTSSRIANIMAAMKHSENGAHAGGGMGGGIQSGMGGGGTGGGGMSGGMGGGIQSGIQSGMGGGGAGGRGAGGGVMGMMPKFPFGGRRTAASVSGKMLITCAADLRVMVLPIPSLPIPSFHSASSSFLYRLNRV
jgi:hypothetical protein